MRYIIHALTGWLSSNPSPIGKDDLEVVTTNPKIVRSMKNLLREYGYAKNYVGHFPELGVTILEENNSCTNSTNFTSPTA